MSKFKSLIFENYQVFNSPIPLARDSKIGDGNISQVSARNNSNCEYIKIPSFLNLPENNLAIRRVGNISYAVYPGMCDKTQFLSNYLELCFPYTLSGVSYDLNYNWLVEMYHLMSLDHIKSTHFLTLRGFSVDEVVEANQNSSISEMIYKVSLPDSLVLFKDKTPTIKKSLVSLTLFSAFTVGMQININSNWSFLILFNVLPTGVKSHRLFVDFYSSKKLNPLFLLDPLLKLVSWVTIMEDLEYLKVLSKGSIFGNAGNAKKENVPLENNWLIKRFKFLYLSNI